MQADSKREYLAEIRMVIYKFLDHQTMIHKIGLISKSERQMIIKSYKFLPRAGVMIKNFTLRFSRVDYLTYEFIFAIFGRIQIHFN